jgi:hypothetical protein
MIVFCAVGRHHDRQQLRDRWRSGASNAMASFMRMNSVSGRAMPPMRAGGIANPSPSAVDAACSRRHSARKIGAGVEPMLAAYRCRHDLERVQPVPHVDVEQDLLRLQPARDARDVGCHVTPRVRSRPVAVCSITNLASGRPIAFQTSSPRCARTIAAWPPCADHQPPEGTGGGGRRDDPGIVTTAAHALFVVWHAVCLTRVRSAGARRTTGSRRAPQSSGGLLHR